MTQIVAFEGIDACGKETQVRMLQRWAAARGMQTTLFEYPNYKSETGKKISELLQQPDHERDPLVLQAMMSANRYEEQQLVEKWYIDGGLVILDRYWLSGLVYGQTDGLSLDWLLQVHGRLIRPHRWIVLDIPVGESFRRRPKREDEYERKEKRLHDARRLYREAQDYMADLVVLDANKPPEEVHSDVVRCLEL